MQNLNAEAYEHYHLTHTNFVEAYKMVNEYVTELYRLPKKFLDETEGTMNSVSSKHLSAKAPSANDMSMRVVADFMSQLDEFTMHTIGLFNEHMKHIDETEAYLFNAKALEAKQKGSSWTAFASEYSDLTPKVDELMVGLKQIKERADDTLVWLEKLEVKWEDVRDRVKQAA